MLPFGRYSYLLILAAWSLPILVLQWAAAWRELWLRRRLLAASVLLCGTYLSAADAFAIARGIWQIRPEGVTGVRLGGHLPLEEALFYFLTAAMSAQGFVMIAGYFREREGKRT